MDDGIKTGDKSAYSEGAWHPERIPESRLRALLPYTGADSLEDLQKTLASLRDSMANLSVREKRHKFLPRHGGPTKIEYVLYAGGSLTGKDFSNVEESLDTLGVRIEPIDTLEREFVVSDEVSKARLELVGLVLGADPDADVRSRPGSNWDAIVEATMEKAAVAESADDIPLTQRSHRAFPLLGSDRLQVIDPRLREHFMEATRPEAPEADPIEIDLLLDDTAQKFEQGSLTLDQAFSEWGIEVDEAVEDARMPIPAGQPLGELLVGRPGKRFRWKGGVLMMRSGAEGQESVVSPEDRALIYQKAQRAARLLWKADTLSRKARAAEERDDLRLAGRLRSQAALSRSLADAYPDSIVAIGEVIEMHTGFVFRRVMRFLKRRDVRGAASYGPKDLMQEGVLGLYRALAGYEVDDPRPFIAFARHHIDGAMLGYAFRHKTFTSLPGHLQTALNQIYDIDDKADAIPANGGAHAMDSDARNERRIELAKRIFGRDFDVGVLLDSKRRLVHHESSSKLVPISAIDESPPSSVDMRGSELSSADTARPSEILDTKRYLSLLLTQVLTPREEMVIRARFGIGPLNESAGEMTLEEVGMRIGGVRQEGPVTRTRIGQLEQKALRKLKSALYRKFARYEVRDGMPQKYVDLAAVARVFDIEGFR